MGILGSNGLIKEYFPEYDSICVVTPQKNEVFH